ncbi:GNAT family N-acetyltransferase [soil metagenome]
MILTLKNNEQRKRFETERDGKTAFIDYTIRGNTYNLTHTEVPEEIRGKGIGTQLVKRTLDFIKESRKSVNPACPFVAQVIKKNAEYKSLIA